MKLFKLMIAIVIVSSLGACSTTAFDHKHPRNIACETAHPDESYQAYRPGNIRN